MAQISADQAPPQILAGNSDRSAFDVKSIWRIAAPKLLNLVAISTLLTVAGFFVIQSYLASFSKLFTFNISITQYLAAGVNLVLGILWYLLPTIAYGFILGLSLVLLYLGCRFILARNQTVQTLWNRFYKWVLPFYVSVRPWIRRAWRLYQVISGAAYIVLVIGLCFAYGTFYYAQSPRMFGGGMPADVILVFREDQPANYSIWGFPINNSNARQSEPVQLLIELTDGIIVRNTATNTITIVKNDVLQGIIGAGTASSSQTNTTVMPTQPLATQTP